MTKLFGSVPSFTSNARQDTSRTGKTKAEQQRPKKAKTRTPRPPESVPLKDIQPKGDQFQSGSESQGQSRPRQNSARSLTSFPPVLEWSDYGDPYARPENSHAHQSLKAVKTKHAKQFEAPRNTGWSFTKAIQAPIRWFFSLWNR